MIVDGSELLGCKENSELAEEFVEFKFVENSVLVGIKALNELLTVRNGDLLAFWIGILTRKTSLS